MRSCADNNTYVYEMDTPQHDKQHSICKKNRVAACWGAFFFYDWLHFTTPGCVNATEPRPKAALLMAVT